MLENSILNTPRPNQQLWYVGIADALAWEPTRSERPSALWLCGSGNFKDAQAAGNGRQAAYEFLKANFARLKAQGNGQRR